MSDKRLKSLLERRDKLAAQLAKLDRDINARLPIWAKARGYLFAPSRETALNTLKRETA